MRLLIIVQTYILQKLTYSTIKQLNEVYVMSRCIAKSVYLKKPKRLIIWDGGSIIYNVPNITTDLCCDALTVYEILVRYNLSIKKYLQRTCFAATLIL